jgi:hypothetical protein
MTRVSTSWRRAARTAALVALAVTAAACSDDGTGPSEECIDELDLAGTGFRRSDVEPIRRGDSESGSISTSDVGIDLDEFGRFY